MGLKYNWNYPQYDETFLNDLKEYNISENIAKILDSRGINKIKEVKKYFSDDYEEGYDPFLMHDMKRAVERINNAIENEEKILVYGDYDADGITSTVLLVETLVSLGADVSSYIPNRFEEGYGPNKDAFSKIIKSGISLIITVDNGIAGVDEVELANSLGCDVIITDHHKIQDKIPKAYAVIHPEHPEGQYPFGKLAGVGVAVNFLLLFNTFAISDLTFLASWRYIVFAGLGLILAGCAVFPLLAKARKGLSKSCLFLTVMTSLSALAIVVNILYWSLYQWWGL